MKPGFGLFLSISIILASITQAAHDEPGSRSIYVKNHDRVEKKEDIFLHLYLRNCTCDNENSTRQLSSGIYHFCNCWADFRNEDQPAIQGSPMGLFIVFLSVKCSLLFLKPSLNESSGEIFLELLAPQSMKVSLKYIGAYDLVEFVPGSQALGVDDYLALLAQEKIPIGEPGSGDFRLHYHFYFHDIFNHLCFWIFSPDSFRAQISSRAEGLTRFFATLNRIWCLDNVAVDLIALFKFFSIAKFDSAMGSANNYILIDELLADSEKSNFSHNQTSLDKVTKKLALAMNFGMRYLIEEKSDNAHYIYSKFEIWEFIKDWFGLYGELIIENFSRREKSFDSIDSIKKDPIVNEAFLRLVKLDINIIKEKIAKLKESAASEMAEFNQARITKPRKLISTEALLLEMKFNIQNADKKIRLISVNK